MIAKERIKLNVNFFQCIKLTTMYHLVSFIDVADGHISMYDTDDISMCDRDHMSHEPESHFRMAFALTRPDS